MPRGPWLVHAVSAALVLPGAAWAGAEMRTDEVSGRQAGLWKAIVAVVEATGPDGELLHPTVHGLFREIEASPHVVRIVLLDTKGSAMAGQLRIDSLGADGRCEATVTLNLRTIDQARAVSPDIQIVTFGRLDRTKRLVQVLGHELAHAAWAFADPEHARLAADLQADLIALARRARTEGMSGMGQSKGAQATELLTRLLERPALAAEVAITQELRASP